MLRDRIQLNVVADAFDLLVERFHPQFPVEVKLLLLTQIHLILLGFNLSLLATLHFFFPLLLFLLLLECLGYFLFVFLLLFVRQIEQYTLSLLLLFLLRFFSQYLLLALNPVKLNVLERLVITLLVVVLEEALHVAVVRALIPLQTADIVEVELEARWEALAEFL